MSLAPNARLSWPTLPPCVTHDACRLSKLSRTMRAMRERAQVVDAGRLGAAELGVIGLIAPGDERGEAAGLVLQRAQPQQVLDPLLVGLDGPEHHRRGRAQAGAVRVAHHVEPLVGGRLAVAVQQPCGRDRRGSRRRRRGRCRGPRRSAGRAPAGTGSCDSREM